LSKITYQFKDIPTIKGQILYREGEPADYVYIVKSGQFEVTKTLVQKNTGLSVIMNSVGGSTGKNVEQESTKEIFKNPLKA
jgi:CRP-like cAMP-binding protein